MLMHASFIQPVAARVLFIRAAGVLYATSGSAEVTRRYVWAPLLEDLLEPYPEVCVVYLRACDEAPGIETLKSSLGRLGQRLIEVLTPIDAQLDKTIEIWCQHHPEVSHIRLLVADFATMAQVCLTCDPEQGIRSISVQSALQDWLAGDLVAKW
jgi:hypothetical protein